MAYEVIAPLVALNTTSGNRLYFYQGAPIGEGFDPADLERLSRAGFIRKTDSDNADDVVEIPAGEPDESWTAKQLRAYAEANEIDLGQAKSKADLLALIAP